MADTTCWRGKARANEHGVYWAASRSGRVQIALCGNKPPLPDGKRWEVWMLYTGTHDIVPGTRRFRDEADAQDYANECWRTR